MDGGAGDEYRALQRVRHAAADAPRERDEKSGRTRRPGGAGVHQDEGSGAVRVLRRAGGEARLSEECGLLVTRDATDRNRRTEEPVGIGDAEPPARRQYLGQESFVDAEYVEELG